MVDGMRKTQNANVTIPVQQERIFDNDFIASPIRFLRHVPEYFENTT